MFLSSVRVPSSCAPARAYADVGVPADLALLHVALAHAKLDDEVAQLLEELPRRLRRRDVRLGDDLDERRAATVEVDHGVVRAGDAARVAAGVDELGGVLLHVHPVDAAAEELAVDPVLERALGGQGRVVLADLVRLGQVRIEVVLAVEDVARLHGAAERQRDARGVLDGALVHHGQRAGVREAHRARVHVGLVALGDGTAAEHLGLRVELDVHLEADDRLPGGGHTHDCASSGR